MTQDKVELAALEAEMEAALCAPNWAASLGHVHNAKAALATLPQPTNDSAVELLREAGLVERIAQFVQDWNGETRDGDTFLIADEIREQFGDTALSNQPEEGAGEDVTPEQAALIHGSMDRDFERKATLRPEPSADDGLVEAVKDFRNRAHICRTNPDAFDLKAASVWDCAADALENRYA